MVLSAILKLDAGAFTTPLGKAVEGVKAAIRIAGSLGQKLDQAFATGGMLSDLQAQIGDTPGRLMVLRQAFEDTGVGADALAQTVGVMRRAIAGIGEDGAPTSKTLRQLGLDSAALQGMGAAAQLRTVGAAIRALKSPSEQSAAAMGIFGRSGQRMLTLLKDDSALAVAERSLGGLPALMDRNAAAFDAVSDRIGRIKNKGAGLWAGIAEGLLPLADQVTGAMDAVDLSGIGRRIGEAAGTAVEMFRTAPIGDTVRDLLTVGFGEAANYAAGAFVTLGDHLWKALSAPLAKFSAGISRAVQLAMQGLGNMPELEKRNPWMQAAAIVSPLGYFGAKKLGQSEYLKGFQADSYADLEERARADLRGLSDSPGWGGKIELFDVAREKENIAKIWGAAAATYKEKIDRVAGEARAAADKAAGGGEAGLAAGSEGKGWSGMLAGDALAKIGGYIGGGGAAGERLVALNERTARAVERIAAAVGRGGGREAAVVWGV